MNKRIKKLWIDALTGKSKKKYTQGKFKLRDNGNFCCLGVLCDLHRLKFNRRWKNKIYYNEGLVLPEKVYEWAGLSEGSPMIMADNRMDSLSWLNDNDYDFDQIAQLIKEQLWDVTKDQYPFGLG